mgnify:CR=1 FL=1
MDRRSLLKAGAFGAAGLAASQWLASCTMPSSPAVFPTPVDPFFDCGVLSGLHDHTSTVLWTRVAPAAEASVDVDWEVADDPTFARIVARGTGVAAPERDGTVKVLAEGLAPGTTYWYRFRADGRTSRTGRTRTPLGPDVADGRVRLAVAACQNYPSGYYPAWRGIADEDVDAVVHLGDYIYESGGYVPLTDVRRDPVGPANDLASYRAKYRLYRTDPDLLDAHAAHALVPIWDDHEFQNDYDRTFIADDPVRAAAAYRAWFEYQPVWPTDGTRTYRRLRWGRLVDLTLLDTRQYRDEHPNGGKLSLALTTTEPANEVARVGRTILGDAQRSWVLDGLGAAQGDGVRWKLVGNQVMISPIRVLDLDEPLLRQADPGLTKHAGLYLNTDAWDGYQWERDLLTKFLHDEGVRDTAFLTGDIHSFWQSDVTRDFDEDFSPVVAQEFVCGSISSRAADFVGPIAEGVAVAASGLRPGFRYVDLQRRGYGVLDCTPERSVMQFRHVDALYPVSPTLDGSRFTWAAGGVPTMQPG